MPSRRPPREACRIVLVIAGERGWMMQEFDSALRRSPLRDRVELRGAVSDDELVALYRGAVVLVYPSLQEGFGLPWPRPCGSGVPVITSEETPMSDQFAGAAMVVFTTRRGSDRGRHAAMRGRSGAARTPCGSGNRGDTIAHLGERRPSNQRDL
jgi:hypothetical protein